MRTRHQDAFQGCCRAGFEDPDGCGRRSARSLPYAGSDAASAPLRFRQPYGGMPGTPPPRACTKLGRHALQEEAPFGSSLRPGPTGSACNAGDILPSMLPLHLLRAAPGSQAAARSPATRTPSSAWHSRRSRSERSRTRDWFRAHRCQPVPLWRRSSPHRRHTCIPLLMATAGAG